MDEQTISRAEARAQGFKRYFTGIPCKRGHVCERRVSNLACVVCTSFPERSAAKKAKNKIQRKNKLRRDKAVVSELRKSCTRCGFNHPAALHFHHVLDKTAKVGGMLHRKGLSVVMTEIKKCIVLCANCHAIEHWEEQQNRGRAA